MIRKASHVVEAVVVLVVVVAVAVVAAAVGWSQETLGGQTEGNWALAVVSREG